jgi:hypothetical protein
VERELQLEDYGDESSQSMEDHGQIVEVNIENQEEEMMEDMMDL